MAANTDVKQLQEGLSTVRLLQTLAPLQTRSQWCCANPAEDVFPSCSVLSWHPQHPSHQARRHLNKTKGKTKRRLLLEIVRLTYKCGQSWEVPQTGVCRQAQHHHHSRWHPPVPRHRCLCQLGLKARNCLLHAFMSRALCFPGSLQHSFHPELFYLKRREWGFFFTIEAYLYQQQMRYSKCRFQFFSGPG